MPALSAPPADAKVGAKIEFVAKRLAVALRPQGFTRRGRTLYREHGEGVGRCVQLLGLQGDKWNEGAFGRFTINLGVCFPALLELQQAMPGLEWIAQHASPYDLAFGPGGFQARLPDVLPEVRDPRWPAQLASGTDFWASIEAQTDLPALADGLLASIVDHAVPWLSHRSSLDAFDETGTSALGAPGPRERVLAALLAGDRALARQRLGSLPAHRFASDQAQFRALIELLGKHGVMVADLAWTDPAPHPMHAQRSARVADLKSRHLARVDAFLATDAGIGGREDAFLDAWVEEDAAHQLAGSVLGFRLWKRVAAATLTERRTLLLRLLERLPQPGPTVESTLANVWASYPDYHASAWHRLAVALLGIDAEGCDEAYCGALLQALAGTVAVVTEDLVNDEFKAPVAAIIDWLGVHADPATRFAVRPQIRHLLDAVSDATVARSRQRMSQPPPSALVGEALAAQLTELYSEESRGQFERLYRACPERSYSARDRDAILTLRRWLRAEASGRVPLQIESDDWGEQLALALQEIPAPHRADLTALLEWFDETVEPRPSKRWWRELEDRRRVLPDSSFVEWLARTLPRFAASDLGHFLSAPGYLALPGETSGRLLLGLVHLASLIDTPPLLDALEQVARAAFLSIPGLKIRAPGIGVACLPALARNPGRHGFLAALRSSVRQKSTQAAIDKALESAATSGQQ